MSFETDAPTDMSAVDRPAQLIDKVRLWLDGAEVEFRSAAEGMDVGTLTHPEISIAVRSIREKRLSTVRECLGQVVSEKLALAEQAVRDAREQADGFRALQARLSVRPQQSPRKRKGRRSQQEAAWQEAVHNPMSIPEGPLPPVTVLLQRPDRPNIAVLAHDLIAAAAARSPDFATDWGSGPRKGIITGALNALIGERIELSGSGIHLPPVPNPVAGSRLRGISFVNPSGMEDILQPKRTGGRRLGGERMKALRSFIAAMTTPLPGSTYSKPDLPPA